MDKQPNNEPKMNMPKFNMNWIYMMAIIALGVLYFTNGNENSSVQTTTSYSNFKTWVMKGYAQEDRCQQEYEYSSDVREARACP